MGVTIDKLEMRAKLWNKLALFVPVFFIGLSSFLYWLNLMRFDQLFLVTLIAWVVVAITWWIWTMFSIIFLARLVGRTTQQLEEIKNEVKEIRREII